MAKFVNKFLQCFDAVGWLMLLPLTVSCFSKIQIGFTFLIPAHLGSPGKRAVKRVCVCVCVPDESTLSKIVEINVLSVFAEMLVELWQT